MLWVSLVAQLVKNPPAMWETWVQSLDWEDPLKKGKAMHSSILAWRVPWTVDHQVLLSMGILQTRILAWVTCPPPGDLPNPGIIPRSSTLQADSLPSEPPGKPKIAGVGNLSLLWGIFLTQESNQGLLHFRQMFYKLSQKGSPSL